LDAVNAVSAGSSSVYLISLADQTTFLWEEVVIKFQHLKFMNPSWKLET